MLDAVANWLFSASGLTAHGFCLAWEPWLIATQAGSDAGIFLAYFAISAALAVYARRRAEIVFKPVLLLFAAFILLCGAGHALDLLTLWVPVYRLAALERAATAVISLVTAIAVWWLMPKALALPTSQQMQRVHDALRASEAQARAALRGMERLHNVIEASPTALVLVGAKGEIRLVNAKAEQMFGYDRAALRDQMVEVLLVQSLRKRHVHLRADFLANVASRAMGEGRELFGLRKDGSQFPLEIGLNPIELDGETMVLAGIGDITARRAAELEMRQRREALEQSNAELIRARLRAEQATRAKSRFLAGMSHELRTPLNGILGYAELLRLEGGLTEGQQLRVHEMQRTGRHLLDMITNVLDLSTIEAGELKLEPVTVDPRDIARDCIGVVQPTAHAKGLTLTCDIDGNVPREIVADPTRLRQVVINLLGNAVKFTDRGSVSLRVSAVQSDQMHAMLWFKVVDTGRGVAPERRASLFQEFDRLAVDPNCAVEGAGLGLAISARIAMAMGGSLLHADNQGGGSVFKFEIALQVAKAGATATPAPPAPTVISTAAAKPASIAPRRILVVDDIAMNRDITSSFLRSAGHKVTCADGGGAAVSAAARDDFDIILMDLRMPEVDGFEATRRIRALGGARGRVPIMALTAQAFSEQIDECWRAGMVGHLAKPFTQAALLQALTDVIWEGAEAPARPALAPDCAALKVLDLGTYETSAAFLSPRAVVDYLDDIIAGIDAVRSGLVDRKDFPAQLDAVHALAGKVGMFGFVRLTAAARHFERVGRSDADVEPNLVEALTEALESSRVEARARLAAARTTVAASSVELPLAASTVSGNVTVP